MFNLSHTENLINHFQVYIFSTFKKQLHVHYQCVVHPAIQMNTVQKGSWELIITSSPVRSHYCSVTIYSGTITFKANSPSFKNQKECPNALYCPHCAAMIRSQLVQYHSQIHGGASWFYSLAKWIGVSVFLPGQMNC